jgi:hypothetical protein
MSGPVSSSPDAARDRTALGLLAGIALLALGIDVLRLGFFSDDFMLLDAARRYSIPELLTGQFGIWPWYRPLSRELYFALAGAAGAWAPHVAHALNLICAVLAAWLLLRVTRRFAGAAAALLAAALFLTWDIGKFLVAWGSGFQDLLAVLLTLLALDAWARERTRTAAAWALLAPLAKESAVAVYP